MDDLGERLLWDLFKPGLPEKLSLRPSRQGGLTPGRGRQETAEQSVWVRAPGLHPARAARGHGQEVQSVPSCLFGARGASAAAAAGNIPLPPLLLMNVGETCCAMTLISKENCKAFFFFFPHLLNSAPNVN